MGYAGLINMESMLKRFTLRGLTKLVLGQALAELQEYLRSPAFKLASAAEARAAEDLQARLRGVVQGSVPEPLSAYSAMQVAAPAISDERRLPLTW